MKKCSQHGYTKESHLVTSRGFYSIWGWFALLLGISVRPKRIEYTCTICEELFDVAQDNKSLDEYYL